MALPGDKNTYEPVFIIEIYFPGGLMVFSTREISFTP